MAITLWFAGFVGLIVAAALASARGRALGGDVAARRVIAIAAIAYASLVGAAVWLWGGQLAQQAHNDRLRDGATVLVEVERVRVPVRPASTIQIGHAPTADVRLPGDGIDELARLTIDRDGIATIEGETLAGNGDAATYCRSKARAAERIDRATSDGNAPNRRDQLRVDARAFQLPAGSEVVAIECNGDKPRLAIVVRRDTDGISLAPRAWQHGRLLAERRSLKAGDALRIGSGSDAIPNLVTWEVASPNGASTMLAVPLDPTDCSGWSTEVGAARAVGQGCTIRAGAFDLVAMPFVPDGDAVLARNLAAAIAIGGPPLLLLLVLAASPRRGRRSRAVARALRLCVLGAGLVALACWRLVWAHRIDAMHEIAARVRDNELAVLAIGAALAGNVVLALDALDGRSWIARAICAVLGWAAWLAGGVLLTGNMPSPTIVTIGVIGLSAIAALTPVLAELGGRVARAAPVELALLAIAAVAWIAHTLGSRGALIKLGIAYAVVLAGHRALRTLLTLGRAPAVSRRPDVDGDVGRIESAGDVATHVGPSDDGAELTDDELAALPRVRWRRGASAIGLVLRSTTLGLLRPATLLGSLALALVAVAALDAGVTLAIVGVGLALAMLVAGHDAMYDATQAGRLGLLEREHARLLAAHGLAAIAIAIGAAACAIVASDRELLEQGTLAVLHAPLVAVGLFGLAAAIARTNRRSWAPWLAAALAALAAWGLRDALLERATAGDGVAARRVAAIVDPGYALLRDDHAFVASATAWREAAPVGEVNAWRGQGYFGARIRDPGVVQSIDNDYFPVLVVREAGTSGLLQTVVLLLALIVGAGAVAAVRLRHASAEQRARWLVTGVGGALAVYQPLASLGVLPLTGITWPGLGIDSPGDLWLFVIGAIWVLLGADHIAERGDERIRTTARVVRARKIMIGALIACGIASVIVVVRGGSAALARTTEDDQRLTAAVRYASTLACAAPDVDAATLADAVSPVIAGKPTDGGTARFERELQGAWQRERAALVHAFATTKSAPQAPMIEHEQPGHTIEAPVAPTTLACPLRAGAWRVERDRAGCVATLSVGWPDVEVELQPSAKGVHATCAVALPDDAVSLLRSRARGPRQRIRVVGVPIGASGDDIGEVVLGNRIVRLRAGAPAIELANAKPGVTTAGALTIGEVRLAVRESPRGVVLHGAAELFVADADRGSAWRRSVHGGEVVLDRISLIAAGAPERRVVALFRPPRAWAGSPPLIDSLLADTAGDRVHRIYPHGPALPELGWVNPYDVERSLGLDGWVHAYSASAAHPQVACGTLSPPSIPEAQTCTPSPLDGVLECRVTLQPQLVHALRGLADTILRDPKPHTGRDVTPVRVAFVALRGDSGEILAQGNLAAGRGPLAYAPVDGKAEATLAKLRDEPGEADVERVDWNLPIAVGSTFKPVVARAAELAAPQEMATLSLTAAGHASGCRARRGVAIDPIAGYCPPTSLAGQPESADVHDFLARSPNWFQAALGLVGLGFGGAQLTVKDNPVTLADVTGSDLATWPTDSALTIADVHGPILGRRGVTLAGLRRTPLWSNVELLLGRPLCTLGDRASCERAAARADVCAARALPVAAGPDLRNLVALGPDRIDLHTGDRPQTVVPVREYLQLLRGSGVHAAGSLAQITDAFGRVVYEPKPGALAASWFPAPRVGIVPSWSCAKPDDRTATVLGGGGGLCGVVQPGGTAHAGVKELLADRGIVIYGAKTGTIDSLADIARSPTACARWNATHVAAARLDCGRAPPDDSLFVIAFGVVTPRGTIPITLGIQLQRAGKSAATRAAPAFIKAIAGYLR